MLQLPEPLRTYHRVLVEEFLREWRFLLEALNGRAQGRADFTGKLVERVKQVAASVGVGGLLPIVGFVGEGIGLVVDLANDKRKESKHPYLNQQQYTLPEARLRVVIEMAALEACRRYQYVILTQLTHEPSGGVIPLAKAGVERMLEYLIRNQLPITVQHLVDGLIAGHSGAYVNGYINTPLSLRDEKQGETFFQKVKHLFGSGNYTAEDVYGRSGLMTPNGDLFALGNKKFALHKMQENVRDQKEAFFDYGYAELLPKSRDPKYGYMYVSERVVQQLYGHLKKELGEKPWLHHTIKHERRALSETLQAQLAAFKPAIVAIDKTILKKYLAAHKTALAEKSYTTPLSLLDFVRQSPSHSAAQFIVYDPQDIADYNLSDLDLAETCLDDCCFLYCRFGGSLAKTTFRRSHVQFSDFTQVKTAEGIDLTQAQCQHVKAQGLNLTEGTLTQSDWSFANLHTATLTRAHTLGAIWYDTTLTEIISRSTDEKASLSVSLLQTEQQRQEKLFLSQQKKTSELEQSFATQQKELLTLQAQIKELMSRAAKNVDLMPLTQFMQVLQQEQQARLCNERTTKTALVRLQTQQELHGKTIIQHDEQLTHLQARVALLEKQRVAFEKNWQEGQQLLTLVLEQKIKLQDMTQRVIALDQQLTATLTEQAKQLVTLQRRMSDVENSMRSLEQQMRHTGNDDEKILALKTHAQETLKRRYLGYTEIKGLFGRPFQLEGQYINLQMLYRVALKDNKSEGKQESKEEKTSAKLVDARISSYEDLFGDKRTIKPDDLFKPDDALFPAEQLKTSAATKIPNLLLLQGRAGIGKTTFVHYAVREWAKDALYTHYDWVFTIALRELRNPAFQHFMEQKKSLSVWEWIYQAQFSSSVLNESDFKLIWLNHIEPALKQGKVLLILDGFDEIPERHACEAALQALLEGEYAAVPKIITSRPYGVNQLPKVRRDIEIIGFTDDNIHQYIKTYFQDEKTAQEQKEEKRADFTAKVIATLKNQPTLWGSAHIPVNLNLVCGILSSAAQRSTKTLVAELESLQSMTTLYETMESKLYERAYERSNGKDSLPALSRPRKQDLLNNYQHERHLLAKLACRGMQQQQIILPRQWLDDLLLEYFEKNRVQANKTKSANDAALLQSLHDIGMIKPVIEGDVPEADQNYEFIHLTFQEYYTAVYLVDGLTSKNEQERIVAMDIVHAEVYNPRWQIVWWLTAGLLKNNPDALTQYLNILQGRVPETSTSLPLNHDLFQHYSLGLLTRCIDEASTVNNTTIITPVRKQIQTAILELYQLFAQNLLPEGVCHYSNKIFNFSSPFLRALQLSPRLCQGKDGADLYALIPMTDSGTKAQTKYDGIIDKQCEKKMAFIHFIFLTRIATPKVLGELAKLLADENEDNYLRAIYAVKYIGAPAATPTILEQVTKLLQDEDKNEHAHREAVLIIKAIGLPVSTNFILKQLEQVVKLLMKRDKEICKKCEKMVKTISNAISIIGTPPAATPDFLEQLVKLLTDENEDVREVAIRIVGALGAMAATPVILTQLAKLLGITVTKHEIFIHLYSIWGVVNVIGSAAATPAILEQLAKVLANPTPLDNEPTIVADMVKDMGMAAATPDFLEQLAKLLANNNERISRAAITVIKVIGAAAAIPGFLERLAKLLGSNNEDICKAAIEAVKGMGPAAATPVILEQLAKLLMSNNKDICKAAIEAVKGMGPAAATSAILEQLAKLLADKNSDVRREAIMAVGAIGTAAATFAILKQLDKLLIDEDKEIRLSVIWTVRAIGATITPAILEQLAKLLTTDEDESIWGNDILTDTIKVVGVIGVAAATPAILEQLAKLLADKNKSNTVRSHVIDTLTAMGAAATPAILEQLAKLLMSNNEDICKAVLEVVRDIRAVAATPAILEQLAKLLMSNNKDICKAAIEVVRKMGAVAATPAILEKLAKLLMNKNKDISRETIWVVEAIGLLACTPTILERLAELLTDKDIRDTAAIVLPLLIRLIFVEQFPRWIQDGAYSTSSIESQCALLAAFFAGAYLAGDISLQITWQEKTAQFIVRGFVAKEAYQFPITAIQAQALRRLIPAVIEQLQTVGHVDVELLKAQIKTWPALEKDPYLADSRLPQLSTTQQVIKKQSEEKVSVPSHSSSTTFTPTWETVFAELRQNSAFAPLFQRQTIFTVERNKKEVSLQIKLADEKIHILLKSFGKTLAATAPNLITGRDFEEGKLSLTLDTSDDAATFIKFLQGATSGLHFTLSAIEEKTAPKESTSSAWAKKPPAQPIPLSRDPSFLLALPRSPTQSLATSSSAPTPSVSNNNLHL